MQLISYLYLFADKIKVGYYISHIYRQDCWLSSFTYV